MVTKTNAKAAEKNVVEQPATESTAEQGAEGVPMQMTGRSAFSVSLTPAGVVVQTVFVGDDESMRPLPAVLPNLGYALNQIDMLRALVIDKFNEAAQLGLQNLPAQDESAANPQVN